jgi:chromosome segregation ATPase
MTHTHQPRPPKKPKADTMYRRNKEEVEALQAKRHQVEADRQQIAAVIQQLDDKKRNALESTWRKVGGAV